MSETIRVSEVERALIASAQREASRILLDAVRLVARGRGLNPDAVQYDTARGVLVVPPLEPQSPSPDGAS